MATRPTKQAAGAEPSAPGVAPDADIGAMPYVVVAGVVLVVLGVGAVLCSQFLGPGYAGIWLGTLATPLAIVAGPLSVAGVFAVRDKKREGPRGWADRVSASWPHLSMLMAIALALFLLAYVLLNSRDITTVPDVRGMSKQAATSALRDANITVTTITEDQRAFKLKGQVVGQQPRMGEHIEGGSDGSLVVSPGVPVPQVIGERRADAERALTARKLHASVDTAFARDGEPIGTVISQDPENGFVDPGSRVGLTVSKGIRVPSVVGKPTRTAARILRSAGFEVLRGEPQFLSTHSRGLVARQTPAAGSGLDDGSRVELIASRGPEPMARIARPRRGAVAPLFTVSVRLRKDLVESGRHLWLAVDANYPGPFDLIPKSLRQPPHELDHRPALDEQIYESGAGLANRRFELVLIEVSSRGDRFIRSWFRRGRRTGQYPAFDEVAGTGARQLPGLKILARVRQLRIR